MNIYLVGFMGCGKSAVGKKLAKRLRRKFIDSDAAVEARAGKSIAMIFKTQGESAFRKLEAREVLRISKLSDRVAALGGGALLNSRTRALVARGLMVRLTCAEPELWKRLKVQLSRRPLLAAGRSGFKVLLKRRKGAYGGADIAVSTTRRGVDEAARVIAERIDNL